MNNDGLRELPLADWQDTLTTLHMWSQIVGKIANASTPLSSHFWNSTLRLTPRGLSTLPLTHGDRTFGIEFDFISHELQVNCDDGDARSIKLYPRSVADLYAAMMKTMSDLDLSVKIWPMPVEVADPIRFTDDTQHASYDEKYVERFWRILVWIDTVFEKFGARFVGKRSPAHFFWGSFDFAMTRFNGERAPERPGADYITREAYSHKCISHGFWCGGGEITEPVFYAYAAPEPEGFAAAKIEPAEGFYHQGIKEFLLPYNKVRQSDSPEKMLVDFMQSTYNAGADLDHWDRAALERQ